MFHFSNSYEKPGSSYCVMLFFCGECKELFELIVFGSEPGWEIAMVAGIIRFSWFSECPSGRPWECNILAGIWMWGPDAILGEPVRIVGPIENNDGMGVLTVQRRYPRSPILCSFPAPVSSPLDDSPVVCAFVEEAARYCEFFSFSVIFYFLFFGLWPTACYVDLMWFVLIELTLFWRDACRAESTCGRFAFLPSALGSAWLFFIFVAGSFQFLWKIQFNVVWYLRFWLIFLKESDNLVAIDELIKTTRYKLRFILCRRWLSLALQVPHGEEEGISGDNWNCKHGVLLNSILNT